MLCSVSERRRICMLQYFETDILKSVNIVVTIAILLNAKARAPVCR